MRYFPIMYVKKSKNECKHFRFGKKVVHYIYETRNDKNSEVIP